MYLQVQMNADFELYKNHKTGGFLRACPDNSTAHKVQASRLIFVKNCMMMASTITT